MQQQPAAATAPGMTPQPQPSGSNNTMKLLVVALIAALVGAVLGAGAVLLLAPPTDNTTTQQAQDEPANDPLPTADTSQVIEDDDPIVLEELTWEEMPSFGLSVATEEWEYDVETTDVEEAELPEMITLTNGENELSFAFTYTTVAGSSNACYDGEVVEVYPGLVRLTRTGEQFDGEYEYHFVGDDVLEHDDPEDAEEYQAIVDAWGGEYEGRDYCYGPDLPIIVRTEVTSGPTDEDYFAILFIYGNGNPATLDEAMRYLEF